MSNGFAKALLTILLGVAACHVQGQPGTTIELVKPKQYQNRVLTSEKTQDKHFRKPRHFYQNLITHYNYYYNANYRLNDVITRAKLLNRDDYTKLLNFYDYSIDATAKDGDMDSILYKCNAGILLHDLRTDWVDNLYLIMGKTYFYRKNFDSAAHVFQYIVYAFSPREDVNYFTPVGSNASNTNGVFSISTIEDRNVWQKLTSLPPSRNDAMLWEAKVYTEANHYAEAAGMLEVLRNDPYFPQRLQEDLHEAFAYWYYKQKIYDSAAAHLGKCVSIAGDRQAKARREFLTAQMYLLAKNDSAAIYWYGRAAEHCTDPVMEVYANLNSINAYADKTDELLQQKINNLLALARKDRYAAYRDIIYFALAQIVLQKKDNAAAKTYLHKSIASGINNPQQKSRSFMMLADICYDTRDFIAANNFYDSVSAAYIASADDKARLQARVAALKIISKNLLDVHAQDSLQAIARLPKAQQDAIIKKVLRQLRKQQGLKEEEANNNNNYINPAIRQTNAPDLFAASNSGEGSGILITRRLRGRGLILSGRNGATAPMWTIGAGRPPLTGPLPPANKNQTPWPTALPKPRPPKLTAFRRLAPCTKTCLLRLKSLKHPTKKLPKVFIRWQMPFRTNWRITLLPLITTTALTPGCPPAVMRSRHCLTCITVTTKQAGGPWPTPQKPC